MSKHDRKRAETKLASSGSALRQEVERLIERGRLKDAVKQAKLCYRQESTPDHHRLLERAYFLRAKQLHQNGMPASAAEVAQHLLEFGVTDPGLPAELAPLLLAVGLSAPALALGNRLESPEAQSRLLLTAADQTVLHPDRAGAAPPEIRQGGLLVRGALEALDAGDEDGALTRLRDIARNSPFADWRYFVRGLAAFRRGEAEQVAANWDRLDPDRAAARIARFLRGATGEPAAAPEQPAPGPKLTALEAHVFGEPVLDRLEQLRDLVAQERWPQALRLLSGLRLTLRRADPRLAERVTRVLLPPLIQAATEGSYREAQDLIGSFTRAAEPLPIDPRWNRLWALIWEGPQGELAGAENYWRNYLADLKTLPSLSAEERQLAQALVWKRLGELHADEADVDTDSPFGIGLPSQREIKRAQTRAIECLEESLRLAPRHLPTYQSLVQLYTDWDQPAQAEAAARRLLEAFPDHLETLRFLSHHHFARDEPDRALPYVVRARALKPLDEALRQEEWRIRVSLARHHALKHRWDEGRAELAQAEAAWPEHSAAYFFLARKAAFELKAGQDDRAEAIIQEAQGRLAEPTPLWLALLIEAIRYSLPKGVKDRFEHLWQTGLAKKGKSETAGLMAELLAGFLASGTAYTGRDQHVRELVEYLKRTSRVRFRRPDLLHICVFLSQVPKETALLDKLAKRGLKNFPDSPLFPLLLAGLEMQTKGPYRANMRQVKQHLDQALALAQASSDPRDTQLVPQIKEKLALVTDLAPGPFGLPFPGFGGGPRGMPRGMPPDLFELFARMGFDDDDVEEEDDFDDEEDDRPVFGRFFGPPRPRQSGPGGSKRKAKKKKR